jgi:Ca-activated chloride channel family protein
MRLLFIILLSLIFPYFIQAVNAQEQQHKKTILVLDGSGSMWGQIEGVSKIEIARSVIGDLLKNFPADQHLGLTVYGHNRKGDCSDIETLVNPAVGTKEAILKAVNSIKPMGKTPLSEAVMQAAEVLKFTEEAATVILISDGKETCDFDPCEVGKKLEESGVDFTAHVVGFDVSNIEDRAQLKCLAENTGGKFLTASNAEELTKALETVSAPEPSKMHDTRFVVVEEGTKLTINEGLVWSLRDNKTGEVLIEKEAINSIARELTYGAYKAEVTRVKDNMTAEMVVTIDENSPVKFNLELPVMIPPATISAPDTALIGSIISVQWTGPNEPNDIINIREVDNMGAPLGATHTSKGSPLNLQMPGKPGEYVIRYLLKGSRYQVLATHPITIEETSATLNTPDTAKIGSTISVEWTGPNYKHDYINIRKVGNMGAPLGVTDTSKGSPLNLKMPGKPGEYVIRYVLGDSHRAIVTHPITIEETSVTLNAPDTAKIGSTISVEWTGPDNPRDYIRIQNLNVSHLHEQTRTLKGSPLSLQIPSEAGNYEISYVLGNSYEAVTTANIKVEPVFATLNAPATVIAGSTVSVEWTGPDYKRDYILIAKAGTDRRIEGARTSKGSPLTIDVPKEPGAYEILYRISDGGYSVIERRAITVQ